MSVVIPESYGRLVHDLVVEPQDTDRRGGEQQRPAEGDRLQDPAGRDDPEDMAVGEESDVASQTLEPLNQLVDSIGDLLHRLAAGAAVLEEVPAGPAARISAVFSPSYSP